jgi:hypothetical protein
MSDDLMERIELLEREVEMLRALLRSSTQGQLAEQLAADAERRCTKRLRRVRKRLLLASHTDKVAKYNKTELANHINLVVREILKL